MNVTGVQTRLLRFRSSALKPLHQEDTRQNEGQEQETLKLGKKSYLKWDKSLHDLIFIFYFQKFSYKISLQADVKIFFLETIEIYHIKQTTKD